MFFTHRICSCCCSESSIAGCPECVVFDGARATGVACSTWVLIGLNRLSARLELRWRRRRVNSCFSSCFFSSSSVVLLISSVRRSRSSRNSLFSLSTERIEIPSIASRRSFTLYKGIFHPFFSLSTKLITLKINCFSFWEYSQPVGIFSFSSSGIVRWNKCWWLIRWRQK